MQDCDTCKHMKRYVQEDNENNSLHICEGDDFDENEEGIRLAPDVKDFDGSNCLLYERK